MWKIGGTRGAARGAGGTSSEARGKFWYLSSHSTEVTPDDVSWGAGTSNESFFNPATRECFAGTPNENDEAGGTPGDRRVVPAVGRRRRVLPRVHVAVGVVPVPVPEV